MIGASKGASEPHQTVTKTLFVVIGSVWLESIVARWTIFAPFGTPARTLARNRTEPLPFAPRSPNAQAGFPFASAPPSRHS